MQPSNGLAVRLEKLTKRFGDEALRYAILSGLIFYVISAAILLLTTRRLKKDLIA